MISWPGVQRGIFSQFPAELLKELKYDQVALAECHNDMLECGEHAQGESPDHSVYSSLSDPDVDKECRVKIVKVTNVYKVAYLKHYIKQKRLRRNTKQALLKKGNKSPLLLLNMSIASKNHEMFKYTVCTIPT